MKVILGIFILSLTSVAWVNLAKPSSREKGDDKTSKGQQITGKQVSNTVIPPFIRTQQFMRKRSVRDTTTTIFIITPFSTNR